MNIPVRNIYFLLAYAWDRLEESDMTAVAEEDFKHVVDLMAKVLSAAVRHLLKRGLDRGYIESSQVLAGIRGKIDFSASMRANLFSHGRAQCILEELTTDVMHNRIIAETMRRL